MAIPFAIPGAVLSVVAEVVIPEASAYNADVSYANLQGARLTNANLQDINLHEANLRNADLLNANLHHAYLGFAEKVSPKFMPLLTKNFLTN